jgi:hypothetical protein
MRRAEEERIKSWEDELIEIADDARLDKVERRNNRGVLELMNDPSAVARSKLRVETRRALLRANCPAKWGEAIQVVNPEQQDMFASFTDERLDEIERNARAQVDRENAARNPRGSLRAAEE